MLKSFFMLKRMSTHQEIQMDVAAIHQSTVLKVERTSHRAIAGIDSQDF